MKDGRFMNSHNFFSNHYEKIILAGLLLVFSGVLYWQLSVIQEAQNRKVDHIVNQKEPDADYRLANYETDPHYAVERSFTGKLNWAAWDKNSDPKEKIDLMVPPEMAPCPNCYWVISKTCFPEMNAKKSGRCTNCGYELKPRTSDTEVVQIVKVDADENKNLIPDEWERQFGIFGKKDEDPDKDGFTSKEEFDAKTSPVDPKSHPAFATKLVLMGVPKTERIEYMMPVQDFQGGSVMLKNVDIDDKTAEFVFKPAKGKGRQYRAEVKVGDQIMYRKATTTFKNPASGFKLQSVESDESVKIVSEKDGTVFLCEVDKPIQTPYAVVVLYNKLTKDNISTQTGAALVLGSADLGTEEYTVGASGTVDDRPFVTVKNAAGKLFVIGLDGLMMPEAKTAADAVSPQQ